jgi:ABC-type oligopeptide transport system ATPase subunit
MLKKHGLCDTKTCYSRYEIQDWVLTSGCVWCHHLPNWTDFEPIQVITSQEEQLTKLISSSSKLCVPIDSVSDTNSFIGTPNNKILINMIGITGAGKSTVSKKIYDFVTENCGSCLIVSADKWSKKGIKRKQLQTSINKEIRDFDKSDSVYKVLVVDICNENGPTPNCFGFDTRTYSTFNFYPNFDKIRFDDYQSWCLRNVLSRPMHTESSLYWLNPESVGVGTCIKVHNIKTTGLKKLLGITSSLSFSEYDSIITVMEKIKIRAETYDSYLMTKNLDEIVIDLLKSSGYPL